MRLVCLLGWLVVSVMPVVHAGDWIDAQRRSFKNQNQFRRVEDAMAASDYTAARVHLEAILERDPESLQARRMLLDVYQSQEEWKAGLALCDSLLAADPSDHATRLSQGFMALRLQQYSQALQAFERLIGEDLDEAELLLVRENLAGLYVKLGRLTEARVQGERLLKIEDTVARRRFLADVAVKEKRWDKALEHLERALARADMQPEQAVFLELQLARAYTAEKATELEVAKQSYRAVVAHAGETDARLAKALSGLMSLHYADGDYAEALKLATHLFRIEQSVETLLVIAECRAQREEWPESLAALQMAERMAVSDAQRAAVLMRVGNVDFAMEAYADADQALSEAARLLADTQEVAPLLLQQAEIAIRRGRPEEAVVDYEAYLKDAEVFPETVAISLLEAMKQAGQHKAGFSRGKTLLAAKERSASFQLACLKYLLDFSRELGRQEDVYALARELVDRERQATLHMLQAARSADKLKRYEDATEMYTRFLDQELDPEVALEYHYMLKRQGQTDGSEVVLLAVLAKPGLSAATEHEVRYELAQAYRAAGRSKEYETQLRALVKDTDEARFWGELADELYGSGRHEMAAEAFAKSIVDGNAPTENAKTAKVIAGIYLTLKQPAKGAEWLAKARELVPPDDEWRLLQARCDYHMGNFGAAASTLLTIEQKSDVTYFYIGFAYYRDGKTGLAYHYLGMVSNEQELPLNSRKMLFANRAFLAFDQGQYEEAMEAARMATELEPSSSLELLRLKALVALERYEDALARARSFLERSSLAYLLDDATSASTQSEKVVGAPEGEANAQPLQQSDWLDVPANLSVVAEKAAVSAFRLGDKPLAIRLISGAIDVEPERASLRYLRALGYHASGELELAANDYEVCLLLEPNQTVSFWGDYAVTMGKLRQYREGTDALARVLLVYPYSIDDHEEAGYQNLTWGRNDDAQRHFATAIDLYTEVSPYLDDEASVEYQRARTAMRQEYTKLDKHIGLQAYFTRTDYDLEGPVPTPSIDGALPSQTGVELSWRPPYIGFRNDRIFEIFGRLLSDFEDDSWKLDEESYQGGLGIRGKPFKRLNLGVSFERLFEIGDNSEDNWLLRLLAGRGWGQFDEERWSLGTAGQIYGDVGAFLDDPERWYYYLDGRLGMTVGAGQRMQITVPQLLLVRRWEEETEATEIDNYWLAGVGLTARLFDGERRYTNGRWYLDGYLHYTWGRYDETPAGLSDDERDFEGVVLGINFIK